MRATIMKEPTTAAVITEIRLSDDVSISDACMTREGLVVGEYNVTVMTAGPNSTEREIVTSAELLTLVA